MRRRSRRLQSAAREHQADDGAYQIFAQSHCSSHRQQCDQVDSGFAPKNGSGDANQDNQKHRSGADQPDPIRPLGLTDQTGA